MSRKYRFRKVYFICNDNSVFSNYEVVNCYKKKQYVDNIHKQQQQSANAELKMWAHPKKEPAKRLTVHGFYLVHESLFDELLRDHCKEVCHQ